MIRSRMSFMRLLPIVLMSLFVIASPKEEAFPATGHSPLSVAKHTCDNDHNGKFKLDMQVKLSSENKELLGGHYHVYLDGRMITMFSMHTETTTVTIPSLSPGEHHIWIIAADEKTHRILHQSSDNDRSPQDSDMSDMMDMGSMEGMSMPSDSSVLSHIPKNAIATTFDIQCGAASTNH